MPAQPMRVLGVTAANRAPAVCPWSSAPVRGEEGRRRPALAWIMQPPLAVTAANVAAHARTLVVIPHQPWEQLHLGPG